MRSDLSVSVIICTCNRAASLRATLESLGKVRIPLGWQAEVVVVDNASTDETAKVARNATLNDMTVHYLYEPKRGKSNALNVAMAKSRGEILLFTDDDVAVPENWVEQMASPLFQEQFDMVVGKIALADNLFRPWMTASYKGLIAVFDFKFGPLELVGANGGFRRTVLERVQGFDPELGPGALGLGEDTLFGWQVAEAGFRIGLAPGATVVHQPHPSRLLREAWLKSARNVGRSRAYLHYHWEHEDINAPFLRWMWMASKLRLRRLLQPPPPLDLEGCPPWELSYVQDLEMYRQFRIECRRPRNYSRRGLTKRSPAGTSIDTTSRPTNPIALRSS